MQEPIWPLCLTRLENDLPIQQFNTWIRPLQAVEKETGLTLLAPNRYVRDTVERDYLGQIAGLANNFRHDAIDISIDIGSDRRIWLSLPLAKNHSLYVGFIYFPPAGGDADRDAEWRAELQGLESDLLVLSAGQQTTAPNTIIMGDLNFQPPELHGPVDRATRKQAAWRGFMTR